MPYTCVVPGCKGNYRSGPKVQVFRFPKDAELANKWIRAIKRENFTPTRSSKVCVLHFRACDIKKEASAFDEKTGRTVRARLKVHRLEEGAIPCLLPNCPSSGPAFLRESPDNSRTEQIALSNALDESRKRSKKIATRGSSAPDVLHEEKFTITFKASNSPLPPPSPIPSPLPSSLPHPLPSSSSSPIPSTSISSPSPRPCTSSPLPPPVSSTSKGKEGPQQRRKRKRENVDIENPWCDGSIVESTEKEAAAAEESSAALKDIARSMSQLAKAAADFSKDFHRVTEMLLRVGEVYIKSKDKE